MDAGIKGTAHLKQVDRSAMSGIVISSIMRYVLFLAVLSVVAQGVVLDVNNPPASVFRHAAGELGFRIFWGGTMGSCHLFGGRGGLYFCFFLQDLSSGLCTA